MAADRAEAGLAAQVEFRVDARLVGADPSQLRRRRHHPVESPGRLRLDSHGAPVVDPVWELYRYTLARGGRRPTLIEWDNDVPDWTVLADEAARADAILGAVPA